MGPCAWLAGRRKAEQRDGARAKIARSEQDNGSCTAVGYSCRRRISSASAPSQDFSKRPAAVQRSTRHTRAGQLSCPTSHQLLDFLLQRDSKVAGPPPPSRRTQRFEVGGPALSHGEATSGDRRGFVLRRHRGLERAHANPRADLLCQHV